MIHLQVQKAIIFVHLLLGLLAPGFLMLNVYVIILASSLSFRLESQVSEDECGPRQGSTGITSHLAVQQAAPGRVSLASSAH